METRRILNNGVFAVALVAGVGSFTSVAAYSAETTHPALTSETIKFYNLHYPATAFSAEERQLIMQGSTEEDHPVYRVINHFYDPVYNRGLKGYISAKTWANGTRTQALFVNRNALAGISEPLYSSPDDYSWDRSIYEYVHGDQDRALRGLGHTLHLIQDQTVPDHTRDDMHPPAFDFGSPYEAWTSQFTPQNIDTVHQLVGSGQTPVLYGSLEEYMDKVAMFTNNNFFSKDTLPFPEAGFSSISTSKYPVPSHTMVGIGFLKGGEIQSFGVANMGNTSYRLVEVWERKDKTTGKINRKVFIHRDKEEEPVLSDYWNILSKQAVLNGAGVIKLFFDEVEKEKQTLALYKKNNSILSKLLPQRFAGQPSPKGDLAPRQNVAAVTVALAPSAPSAPQTTQNSNPAPQQDTQIEAVVSPIVDPQPAKPVTIEELVPTEEFTSNDDSLQAIPKLIPLQTPFIGFGGDGGASEAAEKEAEALAEAEEEENEPVIVSPPVISVPSADSRFGTSTVTFSGTASTSATISQDFSSATTTAVGGSWELTLSGLTQGTTTIAFKATSEDGVVSEGSNISVFVDTTPPVIDSFSVLECSSPLRSGTCLSGSTQVSLSWSSSSSDVSRYDIVVNGSVSATQSGTSATVTLANSTTSAIELVARDGVGNVATSSTQNVEVFTSPIVINEIAWAGTQASAFDEWIELYNRSSSTIDLSHVVLKAEDGVPYITLSGSVAADGFYLIERSASDTTSVSEDLVASFSGVGSGSGLSNDGEVLELIHALGTTASTTLDATPAISACSGWCGGEATTSPISMERKDPATAGTDSTNWGSNNGANNTSTDADGNTIVGSPRARNSLTPPSGAPGGEI